MRLQDFELAAQQSVQRAKKGRC